MLIYFVDKKELKKVNPHFGFTQSEKSKHHLKVYTLPEGIPRSNWFKPVQTGFCLSLIGWFGMTSL